MRKKFEISLAGRVTVRKVFNGKVKEVIFRRSGVVQDEGAQGWNDGREAVKRQAYRVFNETRVVSGMRKEQEQGSSLYGCACDE